MNNSFHVYHVCYNIMYVVQMVSYSGILIQVMTTRCKLTFIIRLCRLSLCMTFCRHGLQSYNILFAFCNFHNPFLYHADKKCVG